MAEPNMKFYAFSLFADNGHQVKLSTTVACFTSDSEAVMWAHSKVREIYPVTQDYFNYNVSFVSMTLEQLLTGLMVDFPDLKERLNEMMAVSRR